MARKKKDDDGEIIPFMVGLSPETAHPRAREVLTEPACWLRQDHTSPFGEGEAWAMFDRFLRWRKKNPEGKAVACLKAVLDKTGARDKHWDVVEPAAVDRLIDDDEYGIGIRDPAVIGLAFAQLVSEGRVDDDVRGLAQLALRRQIPATDRLWSSEHFDLDERRRCLAALHDALERLGPLTGSAPAHLTSPTPEPVRDPWIVAFYGGNAIYSTADGRCLSFGDEVIRGEIRLRFDPRDESTDLPIDLLAADLSLADSEGRVWSITSRFSSDVFLIHMIDLSSIYGIATHSKKDRSAFDKDLLLEDVRFSSDDRFYRRFEAGTRMVDIQFKYTTLSFDLAVSRDEDNPQEPILATLKVRLNEDGLFDAKGRSVGPLVFGMNWQYLFRHNTIAPGPGLVSSLLPRPMAFRLTDDHAEPQVGVRINEPDPSRG